MNAKGRACSLKVLSWTTLLMGLACLLPFAAQAAPVEMRPSTLARLTITGPVPGNRGPTVAAVCDMNGDSSSEIAIGDPYMTVNGRPDAGEVRVVPLARSGTFSSTDPALGGLRIVGGARYRLGMELVDLGDVNGDGRCDLLVSAPRKGVAGYKTPSSAYVIYGRAAGGTLDLSSPPAGYGFEIKGITSDAFGTSQTVAGPGDLTGDGLADIVVVGGEDTKGGLKYHLGLYAVRGVRTSGTVDLQKLAASRGTKLVSFPGGGIPTVAAAGRVNADSRPDLIIGAGHVKVTGSKWPVSSAFVLFTPSRLKTTTLPAVGANGFRVAGFSGAGVSAPTVNGVGDVNADGRDDVAVITDSGGGAVGGRGSVGVVFGAGASTTVNATAPASRGYVIRAASPASGEVSMFDQIGSAGDVDGDGRSDLTIRELRGPLGATKSPTVLIVGGKAATGLSVTGSPFDPGSLGGMALRLIPPEITAGCGSDGFARSMSVTSHDGGALRAGSFELVVGSGGSVECGDRVDVFAPN